MTSVGVARRSAGPPQARSTPTGGSAVREATSVGAPYIGRFAPSPTGPLHAGSLVAALASWLDARAHGGQWLVRIEDTDTPRCVRGADREILRQLAACGLLPDAPPIYQSQRSALYQAALDRLVERGAAYPCACSRKDIEAVWQARGSTDKQRHGELIYPGTCRTGLHGQAPRAWRFLSSFKAQNSPLAQSNIAQAATNLIVKSSPLTTWHDRLLGPQQQNVETEVGDFVLRRADGLWAYQLAVVVDDAAQGITHVVRGQDLADNTPRQILLQRALGYPTPQYLHTPLVLAADGQKLSKQNGAQAINTDDLPAQMRLAAQTLGLELGPSHHSREPALACLVAQWAARHDAPSNTS
jgi:glutamyl-Q tRNA(Asp) synthetase